MKIIHQYKNHRVSIFDNCIIITKFHEASNSTVIIHDYWSINAVFEINKSEKDVIKLLKTSEYFDIEYNNRSKNYIISVKMIEKLQFL